LIDIQEYHFTMQFRCDDDKIQFMEALTPTYHVTRKCIRVRTSKVSFYYAILGMMLMKFYRGLNVTLIYDVINM